MAAFLTYDQKTMMTRAMSLGSEAQSDAKQLGAPMANAAMITEVPWIESSSWQPISELTQSETTADLDNQSVGSMSQEQLIKLSKTKLIPETSERENLTLAQVLKEMGTLEDLK